MNPTTSNNQIHSKSKKMKGVVFDESVRVRLVPAVSIDVQSENDIWYNQKEYGTFQYNSEQIAYMMERPVACGMIKKMGDCTRGLESMHSKTNARKMQQQRNARNAVFREQAKYQHHDAEQRSIAIAKAYSRICKVSKNDASILGRRDEKSVKNRISADNEKETGDCTNKNTPAFIKTPKQSFPTIPLSPQKDHRFAARRRRMRQLISPAA